MPKPTLTALRRHPQAVVLLAAPVKSRKQVDHDFEWFDTNAGPNDFLPKAIEFAEEDVKEHGDLVHLLVEVTDTSTDPVTLGRIEGRAVDMQHVTDWEAEVRKDPNLVVAAVATRKTSSTTRVKPQVKGKKPSTAAAVLHKGDDKAEDKAEAATPPKPKPAAKAQALKQRLADSKTRHEPGD